MLLAIFLVSCATSTPSTSVAPSASAAPSAVESASAQPTPVGKQVTAGPCCAGFALEPGRYASPAWFAIPLSLEVGDGWRAFREDKNLAFAFVRGSNDVSHSTQWMALFAPPNEEVEGFMADLHATPLLSFEATRSIDIAAFPGERFEAFADPNPAQAGDDTRMPNTVDIHAMYHLFSHGITDFTYYTESAEAHLRFISVEVGDHTLILYLEAPPAEFDAFMQLVEPVLESIEIAS